jgi:predicted N-acetyltransferase YhbS
MHSSVDLAILIRLANESDDAATGELLVESFVEQYRRNMPEVVVSDARKADLRAVAERRARARVLVAEVEGVIAGTTTIFAPGDATSRTRDRTAAEMRYMAVGLGFTGSGVADRLISAGEEQARRLGASSLALHVRRGARGVARFYERHGFERNPADDCALPDIYLEAYRKNLGNAQPGT